MLEQLGEATKMLQVVSATSWLEEATVPSMKQTAKAYDRVRKARQFVKAGKLTAVEKPVKDAALALRETLTLQCCAATISSTSSSFEAAVVDAFDRHLDVDLFAEIFNSFTKVVRLARVSNFNATVHRIFGDVSGEDCAHLLDAYNTICVAHSHSPL